jgi:hypothetical protein
MKIGILGRQPAMMQRALALAAAAGHEAIGELSDAALARHLEGGALQALIIGGGVEPASREAMRALAATHGVRVLEPAGPDQLPALLSALR